MPPRLIAKLDARYAAPAEALQEGPCRGSAGGPTAAHSNVAVMCMCVYCVHMCVCVRVCVHVCVCEVRGWIEGLHTSVERVVTWVT